MAFKSNPTVTRPANTTAYTAGDVVGGAITFAGIAPYGGDILVTSTALRINVTGIPAGMTSFRLHLYTSSPTSALADNAAWDLPADDRAAYVGYIDLGSPVDVGSTLFVQADQINKQIKLAAGSSTLYGYLTTTAGYTPTSAAVKVIELHTVAL